MPDPICPTCPNDGSTLPLSTDPQLSGCYECLICGYVYCSPRVGNPTSAGNPKPYPFTVRGTPSQVVDTLDRLAREDEKPS